MISIGFLMSLFEPERRCLIVGFDVKFITFMCIGFSWEPRTLHHMLTFVGLINHFDISIYDFIPKIF